MKTFEDAEVALAKSLPGYTARKPQQELARFVEGITSSDEIRHGLAEAGTGTGKSLATVIPAILSGKKVVVATATKALQDQYSNKDLPFLEEHLGHPFTWANLKGRSNYVCLSQVADAERMMKAPNGAEILAEIKADESHDGDFDNFEATITEKDRWALSISSQECPGKKECPFYQECFATKAVNKAKASQVVITNDMMMLTDLRMKKATNGGATMLGHYDLLMVDEAHELEEWTTKALESAIKERGITQLVGEAENFARANDGKVSGAQLMTAYKAAWRLLPGNETRLPLTWWMENAEPFMELREAFLDLGDQLAAIKVSGDRASSAKARLRTRCANEAEDLAKALLSEDRYYVRWVEMVEDRRTRETYKNINMAPVYVGTWLGENIWSQNSAVLLSATLSVGGKFDYLSGRLGLPSETTSSFTAGTPFDYTTQSMLFLPPSSAPSPKERGAWLTYSANTTRDLVQAAGGGALLLYTSRSAMQQAYDMLAPVFEGLGFTCLMQGTEPNPVLARKFSEDTHSILFALKSFMTGVDFQGETCRLVIVDKLPFAVPTDPIFASRSEEIKARGGNDFSELTIPSMSLTLKQAFGRLIRTVNDHGVVAILDSRLSSTGWGKSIVRGLPNAPVTNLVGDVQGFFS